MFSGQGNIMWGGFRRCGESVSGFFPPDARSPVSRNLPVRNQFRVCSHVRESGEEAGNPKRRKGERPEKPRQASVRESPDRPLGLRLIRTRSQEQKRQERKLGNERREDHRGRGGPKGPKRSVKEHRRKLRTRNAGGAQELIPDRIFSTSRKWRRGMNRTSGKNRLVSNTDQVREMRQS